jgi:hypothetical protein
MNKQEVHITVAVAVAPGGRTEYASVERCRSPAADLITHAFPELNTEVGENVGNWCGDMLPIELVHAVATHFHCLDDSLVHQTTETTAYADLRTSRSLCGDLANSQWSTGACQNCENGSIQRRRH